MTENEIEKLKNIIKDQEAENKNLKTENDFLSGECKRFEAEIKELREAKDRIYSSLSKMGDAFRQKADQLEEAQEEIIRLRGQGWQTDIEHAPKHLNILILEEIDGEKVISIGKYHSTTNSFRDIFMNKLNPTAYMFLPELPTN